MEKLIKKVRKILSDRFHDAEIELEPLNSGEKITGMVIWKGFSRFDELGRQRVLTKLFEESLTQNERRNISLIFASTPREMLIFKD